MVKSSFVSPVTKWPLSSLTVAVTLTSSTPLLNRNAIVALRRTLGTDHRNGRRGQRRERGGEETDGSHDLPHGLCELCLVAAPVDVADNPASAAECHAISALPPRRWQY
jgi:hypothetical protein